MDSSQKFTMAMALIILLAVLTFVGLISKQHVVNQSHKKELLMSGVSANSVLCALESIQQSCALLVNETKPALVTQTKTTVTAPVTSGAGPNFEP